MGFADMSEKLFIGIMSGTSMDGIDLVMADFAGATPRIVAATEERWPGEMLPKMHALCLPGEGEIDLAGEAGLEISRVFARGVERLLAEAQISRKRITAIGSHGQTVRHRPEKGFSVQIGSGALLAELTGIDVITDFRSADLASGGQGAPLVPAFHNLVFRNSKALRFVINIGGISNISVLDHDAAEVPGFDTGPGNTLMDALTRLVWREPYDRDARHARQGKICNRLLERLMAHPYFDMPWPKSTGRETFTLEYAQNCMRELELEIPPEDLLRTLLAFTSRTIADAVLAIAQDRPYEAYVCGGGARNNLLMSELRQDLAGCGTFGTTALIGADPDYVEALAFAWLALRFAERKPGNLPSATGARKFKVLGCLYPAG